MTVSVTMPRLGESVTEGTVTRWLKQEGDTVEADEPLLEVSTDKVDTEIPSPAAGVLTRIVVREDETADVGAELAVIDGGGSGDGATATQEAPAQEAPAQEAPAEETPAQQAPAQQAPAQQAEPGPAPGGLAGEERAHEQAQPPEQEQPAQQQPAQQAPAPAAGASEGGSADGSSPGGGDSTVVTMPALGESVTEGTVTRWLKEVGDSVEVDEPLLEVSTDKVDTEIPSPAAGTLLEIKVPEDETADVGAELAVIGSGAGGAAAPAQQEAPAAQAAPAQEETQAAPSPQEAAPQQPAPQQRPEPEEPEAGASYGTPEPEAETAADPRRAEAEAEPAAARAKPAPAQPGTETSDGGGYVTPLVRKLAGEHDIDLASVNGTGVGGRIRRQDVLEAAAKAREAREAEEARRAAPARTPAAAAAPAASRPAAPSPLRGRTEKLTRTRATIARRMVESLQVSAQLTTVVEVDVTRIARLRQQAKEAFLRTHGVKLSFLPFFALAAVEALRTHPNVNAQIDVEAGTVTYHDVENLGVAVDTEMGLIVPVIKEAGDLNLAGLARRIADVAERTRSKKISPDELSGGTFTLTNTGSRGALFDTPIINQPQVAILGTGAVVKRAVVVDDAELGELILPRSMVYLALSYDHRLVDGADAARFLNAIKERLEAGSFEAELGLS